MMVNRADSESFRQRLLTSGYYGRWRTTFGDTAWDLLQRAANMKLQVAGKIVTRDINEPKR